LKSVSRLLFFVVVSCDTEGRETGLDFGPLLLRIQLQEHDRVEEARSSRTSTTQGELEAVLDHSSPVVVHVERGYIHFPHQLRNRMFLKILPDSSDIPQDRDAEFAQVSSRSDTGQHEQSRGSDSPGRDDYLGSCTQKRDPAVLMLDLDSGRPTSVENHSPDKRVGVDVEVLASPRRGEVSPRRAMAEPTADISLAVVDALLDAAVVIECSRMPSVTGGLDESVGHDMGNGRRLDALGA
jgi:hypothetical protein